MQEQEIIELLLQKDEGGMQAMITHYGPLLRYVIAPILSNPQDREDCFSEVVMRIWDKVSAFDEARGSWTAWLTAVARNAALNYRRSSTPNSAEAIPEAAPSSEPSPEEQLLLQERRQALQRALKQLSAGDLALFYRKYYYLQSTAQIASELGMTERAVEGKLYRLRKQLRKVLGGDGYGHA